MRDRRQLPTRRRPILLGRRRIARPIPGNYQIRAGRHPVILIRAKGGPSRPTRTRQLRAPRCDPNSRGHPWILAVVNFGRAYSCVFGRRWRTPPRINPRPPAVNIYRFRLTTFCPTYRDVWAKLGGCIGITRQRLLSSVALRLSYFHLSVGSGGTCLSLSRYRLSVLLEILRTRAVSPPNFRR